MTSTPSENTTNTDTWKASTKRPDTRKAPTLKVSIKKPETEAAFAKMVKLIDSLKTNTPKQEN